MCFFFVHPNKIVVIKDICKLYSGSGITSYMYQRNKHSIIPIIHSLRGYFTSYPKLAYFCPVSQNNRHLCAIHTCLL